MRSRWRRRGGRSTSSGPRCSRARGGSDDLVARARELLAELERPSLRRVINATGVIVHTNLGRAPLPAAARDAVARACDGYSQPRAGPRERRARQPPRARRGAAPRADRRRGGARRQQRRRRRAARRRLAGRRRTRRDRLARPAGRDRRRLPDPRGGRPVRSPTWSRSGRPTARGWPTTSGRWTRAAIVSERSCGCTRRTSARSGSCEDVSIEALCGLGRAGDRRRRLRRARRRGGDPGARRRAGAEAVGRGRRGAGLLLGRQAARRALRPACWPDGPRRSRPPARHPLARALRIDKLSLAALEATLALYRDPAARAAGDPGAGDARLRRAVLHARAQRLAEGIGPEATVVSAVAKVGGGALPLLELEGPAVALTG